MPRPLPALLALLAAASPATAQDLPPASAQPAEAASLYTDLGFGLLRGLAPRHPDNLVISPVSVGLALSVVLNGADGRTAEQLLQALAGPGGSTARLMEANGAFLERSRTASEVTLRIATSLWAAKGRSLDSAFVAESRRVFAAEVAEVDFRQEATAERINRWAAEQTAGKIAKVVEPPLDPELVLMLLNAVYFKGRWMDAFKPEATRPDSFTTRNGRKLSVPFMHRTGMYDYFADSLLEAARLPYQGGAYSAILLLPTKGHTAEHLLATLSADRLNGIREGLRAERLALSLPRFKLEGDFDLIPPLQALGVTDLFDRKRAGLGRILAASSGPTPTVSRAAQSTFLEVNEEGTEAAAVTRVGLQLRGGRSSTLFRVDRPFVFLLLEDATGTVLFAGRIGDPR